MNVNQKLIAEQLNLSVATVSRALASNPAIRADTRAAVLAAAARLGYRKTTAIPPVGLNSAGRRLGVIAFHDKRRPLRNYSGFTRMLSGMGEGARDTGSTLSLEYFGPAAIDHLHEPDKLPACLRTGGVEGLILCGPVGDRSVAAFARLCPCVRMAYHDPMVSLNCVDHDEFRSMTLHFTHLSELGHRRIGFLHSNCQRSFNRARLGAFAEITADSSDRFNREVVIECATPTEECFDEAVAQIDARRALGITAWICSNDDVGYEVLRAMRRRGRSAPEDVSITGFDNFAPPHHVPKLTTIEAPFEDMGRAAVRMLVEQLASPLRDPVRLLMSSRLVVGRTTGPLLA